MAKLTLNRLAKTDDYCKALRVALEIEDNNLTAKRYFGGDIGGHSYAEIYYWKKVSNIAKLVEIAEQQDWTYGIQASDVRNTSHIIYFEIPGVGQVSWHHTPRKGDELPVYPGEWDGQVNATLRKLEGAITQRCNQVDKESNT